MATEICKQAFLGYHFFGEERKRNGEGEIYRLTNNSSKGKISCYDVSEGIQLTYNRLEMGSCFQKISPEPDLLLINHCLEGCYECEFQDGTVSFMGEGDLCISDLGGQAFANSRLPTYKYIGISILLDLHTAQSSLDALFPQANINLFSLRDYLCADGKSLMIRARSEVDHIFSELYHVDERIRVPYYTIKIIELFLFLGLVERKKFENLPSFSRSVVSATKSVYAYLIENPIKRVTIGELSFRFNVADSSLKRCFKAIAGKSIGTFMKEQRIQAAANILLNKKDMSIAEVAELVGYENAGKFSAAFKSVYKQTPLVFRGRNP